MSSTHQIRPTFDTFTPELQHAMAQYEAARIRYRVVVRASLNGTADGSAIRAAIEDARVAYADLERCRSRAVPVRGQFERAPSPWALIRARLIGIARTAAWTSP